MNSRIISSVLVIFPMLAFASACASATGMVSVPGAGEETVPRGVLTAVRARWPGAELAAVAPVACPGLVAPATGVFRADFNGDGMSDVALGVTTGDATRLVVAFARLGGDYVVSEIGEAILAGPLTLAVAPRGSVFHLEALTVESFFGTDTFISGGCDGQRTAWLWTGSAFQPQRLAS